LTENELTNQKNLDEVVEKTQQTMEAPEQNPVNEPAKAAGEIVQENKDTAVATAEPVVSAEDTGVYSTSNSFETATIFDNGPHDDFDWEIDKREGINPMVWFPDLNLEIWKT